MGRIHLETLRTGMAGILRTVGGEFGQFRTTAKLVDRHSADASLDPIDPPTPQLLERYRGLSATPGEGTALTRRSCRGGDPSELEARLSALGLLRVLLAPAGRLPESPRRAVGEGAAPAPPEGRLPDPGEGAGRR